MKYESNCHTATARLAWTYSVQSPGILSPLWMLERLASLSIPISGLGLIVAAKYLGLLSLS